MLNVEKVQLALGFPFNIPTFNIQYTDDDGSQRMKSLWERNLHRRPRRDADADLHSGGWGQRLRQSVKIEANDQVFPSTPRRTCSSSCCAIRSRG
jgi:hypothetical protein